MKKRRRKKKEKERNRLTASILKQDPNTESFKQTLIYFNTDTQYAQFWGNPLHQATKRHLNNRQMVYLLFVVLWLDKGDFPKNFAYCVFALK
ncbi:MAG: hypothetical protein LGB69_08545 [Sulfurovum sp.]|nr:hypothetical protein [Sulfurovum sp.]